jgi:membrane-associated protease RseP (regulator of RpoE activity)
MFGVKVHEFAIGMGPRIFSKEKNGTKYSLCLVPMGGFCAMEGEDEESEDEIEEYTGNHDEHALPCGFGAEFPGLLGLLHLLYVEVLVNHTRELYIASEGEPAHYILGLATLGLEAQEGLAKEERETLDTHAEEAGKEEMTQLVDDHKDGEGEKQLDEFYQKYGHVFEL